MVRGKSWFDQVRMLIEISCLLAEGVWSVFPVVAIIRMMLLSFDVVKSYHTQSGDEDASSE